MPTGLSVATWWQIAASGSVAAETRHPARWHTGQAGGPSCGPTALEEEQAYSSALPSSVAGAAGSVNL